MVDDANKVQYNKVYFDYEAASHYDLGLIMAKSA